MQTLRKDGLIQLTGRSLKVLDWEGLREVGDFDELYLHQLPGAIEQAGASGPAANRGAQKR